MKLQQIDREKNKDPLQSVSWTKDYDQSNVSPETHKNIEKNKMKTITLGICVKN